MQVEGEVEGGGEGGLERETWTDVGGKHLLLQDQQPSEVLREVFIQEFSIDFILGHRVGQPIEYFQSTYKYCGGWGTGWGRGLEDGSEAIFLSSSYE